MKTAKGLFTFILLLLLVGGCLAGGIAIQKTMAENNVKMPWETSQNTNNNAAANNSEKSKDDSDGIPLRSISIEKTVYTF